MTSFFRLAAILSATFLALAGFGVRPATAADGDPGYYYQQILDIVNDATARSTA